jgi:hypothetical protein
MELKYLQENMIKILLSRQLAKLRLFLNFNLFNYLIRKLNTVIRGMFIEG